MKAYYVYKVNRVRGRDRKAFVAKFGKEKDAISCCRDIILNPRVWHLEGAPARVYYTESEE